MGERVWAGVAVQSTDWKEPSIPRLPTRFWTGVELLLRLCPCLLYLFDLPMNMEGLWGGEAHPGGE